MKKTFIIIIATLLLSACSSSATIPSLQTLQPPPTPVIEFADKTEPILDVIESTSDTLDSLHAQAEKEQALIDSKEWQFRVVLISDRLLAAANELDNISPIPPETEQVQSYNASVTFHIRSSLADQMEYLSTGDSIFLESARNHTQLAMGFLRASKTTLHVMQHP